MTEEDTLEEEFISAIIDQNIFQEKINITTDS
jgi:hypothetical protein